MILHTVVPPELIFQESEEVFSNQMMIYRNGIPMIVEQSGQMYKIIRIISCNPSDYLNTQLAPGSFIQ